MPEAVRLVVWDLDKTFWSGTLTEGGIEYQHHVHELVVTLARRGIISSICSKNDHAPVRKILEDSQIWDYFIFPSINWQPKAARLERLIECVQLRPASVMFLDDHPLNRNEALERLPDLQVADETFIDLMLDDPRFRGKDDLKLERLAQYKLLERRHVDQQAHYDNTEFLRASGITVTIEFDIEPQIDRAVELINRTNQLNFTKQRLPEDREGAHGQLLAQLNEANVQAGLIKMSDNYGDYGYIGFYLLRVHTGQLVHYCFSCRTHGMGVEKWLFERLRQPAINVLGEVLTDLHSPSGSVDWINISSKQEQQCNKPLGRVFLRGTCEMQAIAHYVGLDATEVVGEFGFERNGLPVPASHTVFLRAALEGCRPGQITAAETIGLEVSDFRSAAAEGAPFDVYIYGFWADAMYALYMEPVSGLLVPFGINHLNNGADLRTMPTEVIAPQLNNEPAHRIVSALRDGFEYRAWSPGIPAGEGESLLEENLRHIFAATPGSRPIFVLLACEGVPLADGGTQHIPWLAELNRQTRRAAIPFRNVRLLAAEEFVRGPADVHDAMHFGRMVYHRIYRRILELHTVPTVASLVDGGLN